MIVHLCKAVDWQRAGRRGEYRAWSLQQDGFIHCSRPDQILAVANAWYRGQHDLVLLWIDPERLQAPLGWEPAATGPSAVEEDAERFPHIYGAVNLDAVLAVDPLPPDEQGRFHELPPGP